MQLIAGAAFRAVRTEIIEGSPSSLITFVEEDGWSAGLYDQWLQQAKADARWLDAWATLRKHLPLDHLIMDLPIMPLPVPWLQSLLLGSSERGQGVPGTGGRRG